MKTHATTISVLVLAMLLAGSQLACSGGGGGVPPFQGGIEVITYLFDGTSLALIRQKGVNVIGQFANGDSGSCSNNGSQLSFSGYTDKLGDIRCPQCEVNAVWSLTINYNPVTGGCTPNLQQIPVDFPCGGAQQPVQCNL